LGESTCVLRLNLLNALLRVPWIIVIDIFILLANIKDDGNLLVGRI